MAVGKNSWASVFRADVLNAAVKLGPKIKNTYHVMTVGRSQQWCHLQDMNIITTIQWILITQWNLVDCEEGFS